MPITSDTSALTSVTASPLEPHGMESVPIGLKIPLPPSDSCSEKDFPTGKATIINTGDPAYEPMLSDTYPIDVVDIGSYNDTMVEAPVEEDLAVKRCSLEDLARLAEEEDYERRHTNTLESEVRLLSLQNGSNRRLKDTLSIAYGNMIDQYKGDDQAGFTGLYEACERLTAQSRTQDQSLPVRDNSGASEKIRDSGSNNLRSLTHRLDRDDQDSITAFLNKIRTDLDYLAGLVSKLPSEELTALTSSYHPAGVDLSVLSNHSHGRTQAYSRDSQMMKLSRRMDSIDRFHNQDPYFCLLYGVFDSSSSLGSREYDLKTDVWSRTCAKVMIDGKPGSEEFIIATIDAFTEDADWRLKPEMELYLLHLLADGAFLLDPPTEPTVEKSASMQPDRASHAIAVADFFDRQTRQLFGILAAGLASAVVPQGVLEFVHAILRQIQDAQTRELAKKFIVSRWYFASFLSSVLVYPEVQGMLLNHHIGQSARQLILKEMVLRIQSQMFAVLSPSSGYMFILPEMQDQIFRIIGFFEPPVLARKPPPKIEASVEISTQQLMLSHWDIIGLIEALHPDAVYAEAQPDPATQTYPPSAASSATLQPGQSDVGRSNGPSTGSSYAVSTSTSDTIFKDGETSDSQCKQGDSAKSAPGEDNPRNGTPNAGPFNGYPLPQLKDICNKLRSLAQRQADRSHCAQDWILFGVSANDLGLHLSTSMLSFHLITASQPPSLEEPQNMDATSAKEEVIKKALLTLLDPSTKFFTRYRNRAIASALSADDPLQDLMENALVNAESQYDFNAAHQWWQILNIYKSMKSTEVTETLIRGLTDAIATDSKTRLHSLTKQRQEYELMMRPLEVQRRSLQTTLDEMELLRKALRVKMWYVSDVKNSSPYEDALLVTKALRVMANPKRGKHSVSITNWARQRLRGSTPYDRAEKQALEALCAPKDHGGTSKLADEQIELTSRWLTKNSIENFCKGEERIHRFCYEVQKSVGKLAGMSLLESPVLWSSHLYRRERAAFDNRSRQSSLSGHPYPPVTPPMKLNEFGALRSPSIGHSPSAFSSLPSARTKGPLDFTGGLQILPLPQHFRPPLVGNVPRYPYPPLSSSQAFGHPSPPMTPLSPKLSEVFGAGVPNRAEPDSKPKTEFVEELRQSLIALIISDLGYLLWASGSETDIWITRAAAQVQDEHQLEKSKNETVTSSDVAPTPDSCLTTMPRADAVPNSNVSNKSSHELIPGIDTQPLNDKNDSSDTFPYSDAYLVLLQRLSLIQDPRGKLQTLRQLEELVCSSIQEDRLRKTIDGSAPAKSQIAGQPATALNKTVPRTKATKLEEVIANCTERRANTLKLKPSRNYLALDLFTPNSGEHTVTSADEIIEKLLCIFHDSKLRPSTLFRDLQFVSAFTPSSILDQTASGKAFWDAGLAGLAFKEDLTNATIRRAHEITNHHLTDKKPPQLSNALNPLTHATTSTLEDAAQLWLTAAKEGSPVAARELALFYLTHPDLVRRATMPFSKAKDVFAHRAPVDRSSTGALDPLTFSVVLHWMDIASSGGDNEAKEFLRANGALGRAPQP